jgi:hypothetical protein
MARKRAIRNGPPEDDELLAVARRAAVFCLDHFPTLWTAGLPVEQARGGWIIPVVIRFPTGHEAELGQLSFDGATFERLTSLELMSERAREAAASPELWKQWYERHSPAVPTGET